MPRTTETCGCRHDGSAWLSKCELHELEDRRIAARWACDRIRKSPGTAYTDDYLLLAAEHDASILDLNWLQVPT